MLLDVVKKIKKVGYLAIDTETNNIKPFSSKIIGISLCWEPGKACYIPVYHSNLNPKLNQLKVKNIASILNPILEDESILKIGQNLKIR